jgi:hypothetical protein
LRLGHAQLGHQLVGTRDPGDVGTELDLRALLDLHLLHDAGDAGAHLQRFHLLAHTVVGILILSEPRAPRDDLRLHRRAELVQALDLDVVRSLELLSEQL